MDYEKKYNEALKWMRELYPGLHGATKEDAEHYFPELRESEDERIRKAIIELLKEVGRDDTGISENAKCMIAYLEKQKEQKPNIELIQRSWYMEGYHDREFGKEPKWIIKTGEDGPKHELNPRYGQPLAEQRPTEEQLHNLNEAIKGLRMDGCERMADSLHSLYNILTKEQKPVEGKEYYSPECGTTAWSEEDADILNCCISSIEEAKENRYAYKETDGDTSYDREIDWLKSLRPSWKPSEEQMDALETAIVRCQMTGLESLYEDLEKLM